jgi:hypothetical protein
VLHGLMRAGTDSSNRGPAFLSTSSILVSVALIFRVFGRGCALLRVLIKHALAEAFRRGENPD